MLCLQVELLTVLQLILAVASAKGSVLMLV